MSKLNVIHIKEAFNFCTDEQKRGVLIDFISHMQLREEGNTHVEIEFLGTMFKYELESDGYLKLVG